MLISKLGKYYPHKKNPLFALANRGLHLFSHIFFNIYGKRLAACGALSFYSAKNCSRYLSVSMVSTFCLMALTSPAWGASPASLSGMIFWQNSLLA